MLEGKPACPRSGLLVELLGQATQLLVVRTCVPCHCCSQWSVRFLSEAHHERLRCYRQFSCITKDIRTNMYGKITHIENTGVHSTSW